MTFTLNAYGKRGAHLMEVEHLATDFQWSQGRSLPDLLSPTTLDDFQAAFRNAAFRYRANLFLSAALVMFN